MPEGFLAIDGILDLYLNVVDGLVVYDKVIEQHFMNLFYIDISIIYDVGWKPWTSVGLYYRIIYCSFDTNKINSKDYPSINLRNFCWINVY